MDYTFLAKQLFFSREAADYLGITVQRLNKLIQEGKIKPLKKNASGSIFHIDELNRRKEELTIFTEIKKGGEKGMFSFDTKAKREALNYATLMNVLNYTEHKMDPLFTEFSKNVSVDILLDSDKVLDKYVEFFGIDKNRLLKEFKQAQDAFMTLKNSDEKSEDISYGKQKLAGRT